MSKLEELIQQLCPNGVEYCLFNQCCDYIRGVTYNKNQEAKSGDKNTIKLLRANNISIQTSSLNFDDVKEIRSDVKVKETQMLKRGDILICAGSGSKEHVGKVAYITEDIEYTFGGFMAVIRSCKNINSRYLFHCLRSSFFSEYLNKSIDSTTINNLSAKVMCNFEIPLPPLPVQEEIVRILDAFTSHAAELQAELQARREQYEYYRDKLLSFEGDSSVEWIELGNILEYEQPTKYIVESTDYDQSYNIPVLTAGQTFILGYTNERTGIYTASSANPTIIFDDFTTAFHWVDFDFKVKSSAMKMLRPKVTFKGLFRYIYYAMKCIGYEAVDHSRHWISKYSHFEIPIPPLPVQEEIVRILDAFTDYTADLQAELQARREQYEYYRNKLLSFPKAV